MNEDEYLKEWKDYCEKNEKIPECFCNNVHPAHVLRWINEVKQLTNIVKTYSLEVVALRKENETLKAHSLEVVALRKENETLKETIKNLSSSEPASV